MIEKIKAFCLIVLCIMSILIFMELDYVEDVLSDNSIHLYMSEGHLKDVSKQARKLVSEIKYLR